MKAANGEERLLRTSGSLWGVVGRVRPPVRGEDPLLLACDIDVVLSKKLKQPGFVCLILGHLPGLRGTTLATDAQAQYTVRHF